jgi:protein OS-9
MKHSIFALPALLRPALFLAAASQNSFSVQDDLLAFPQYDVKFSEDFVSESQAQARLRSNEELRERANDAPPSEIEHYRPADSRVGGNGAEDEALKFEHEYMMLDGQPYLCSIPQVAMVDKKAGVNDTVTKQEEEKELARATDRGWELLSGMQGNCIYFISGWWSYRFCYNEGVRQFHQLPPSRGVPPFPPVEDPGIEGYTLGSYANQDDAQEGITTKGRREHGVQSALDASELTAKKKSEFGYGELVQRGESRYLVQKLDGGTKCDLTGKPRKVEVQVSALVLGVVGWTALTSIFQVPLQPASL